MSFEIKDVMISDPLFWDQKFVRPTKTKHFELVQIKPVLACELNMLWHSRLPKIHWSNVVRNRNYICYGIKCTGVYVGCAIWSSPLNQHFNIDTFLELRRLALSDVCVKNTASWMISKMIKDIRVKLPKIKHLISYQDNDVHLGTIYKASNWQADNQTKFASWQTSRKRNVDQSTSDKTRWKFDIL